MHHDIFSQGVATENFASGIFILTSISLRYHKNKTPSSAFKQMFLILTSHKNGSDITFNFSECKFMLFFACFKTVKWQLLLNLETRQLRLSFYTVNCSKKVRGWKLGRNQYVYSSLQANFSRVSILLKTKRAGPLSKCPYLKFYVSQHSSPPPFFPLENFFSAVIAGSLHVARNKSHWSPWI